MTHQVITYMMKEEGILSRFILQCAPLLKRVKVSALMNVRKEEIKELHHVLQGTGISFWILAKKETSLPVLFYRTKEFGEYVNQTEIKQFLQAYGYREELNGRDVAEQVLSRLALRFTMYCRKKGAFPHEIGVLLAYPVRDVESFIRKSGKGCLLSGYWKVYHDVPGARFTFYLYDLAKVSAVNEYLAGKPLQSIAGG